ncbi:MAG: hypothetical protein ACJ0Q2_04110 [Candidatus Azotimanducaceae bacterium]
MLVTNRRYFFAFVGFFSFLGFVANGLFYSLDDQKKEGLPLTDFDQLELTENQKRSVKKIKDLSALFRNARDPEESSEELAKGIDLLPESGDWVLVGALIGSEDKKAFLLAPDGEVVEISDGEQFGEGNKVVRIGAKSITYEDEEGSEVVIKLYNIPRGGGLDEGS